MRKNVISAIKWTSLSNILIALMQLIQIGILSRYLTANDFGLMAIVLVIIGFSRLFSDMGISNAIIHHQNNTNEQLSSLYWLNIFIGICLFVILCIISSTISTFYNETRLQELIIVLSLTFIILAFGNQYKVLFQKNFKFDLMAKIEVSATFGSFIVATISAVVLDYGIYALVLATLSNSIFLTIFYVYFGRKFYIPSFYYNFDCIKSFINFGMYQTGQSTLNYFNSQFDVILIGKLLGTESLGIYSLVKQLAMRPAQIINPVITKVMFPVMAKIQNDKESLKKIYLKTVKYVAIINFPRYLLLALLAEPLVIIIFGEKWEKAIPILQILSIYYMIRSIGNPIGSLTMATGKVKLEFLWNIGMFVIFPISIYIGSIWLLEGIIYSLVLLMLFTIIPMWYFLIKPLCNATLLEYLAPLLSSFIISFATAMISSCTLKYFDSYFIQIIISFLTFFILYLIMNFYFNKEIIRELRGK